MPKWARLDLSCYSHPFDDFSLDIFELHEKTKGAPLRWVGLTLFQHFQLLERLSIDRHVLENYLYEIERLYRPENPYHNNIHAADVAWSMSCLLVKTRLLRSLSPLELFSCLLSALVHDCDHPGYTNGFLVATSHPIALLHNDLSVLENHHCSIAFQVARQENCNIFKSFSRPDYRQARKMIIELVLGTDFAQNARWKRAFEDVAKRNWPLEDPKDRLTIFLFTLKCADLGHCAKSLPLHKEWSRRILEEFQNQGDHERELGLPVSEGMDRTSAQSEISQHKFITEFPLPLYALYVSGFPSCQSCLDQINQNSTWNGKEARKKSK